MGIGFYQEEEDSHLRLREITRWIVDVAVIFALALFVVLYLGGQYEVTGHSMEPRLEAGDVVLMNKICYNFWQPKRMDLVVFQKEESDKQIYLKRIIGLPGETIQIIDSVIHINGEPLDGELSRVTLPGIAEYPVTLGENEFFVLGDNRDSSEDSRFSNIGNVTRGQIIGKAWFRISPFESIGFLEE